MKKKPNIVIFNVDQMRADSLSHLGNPASITPNLDAFALTEAVSFSNAFCQNPVCVPSRCSFMTGIYPHTKGHRTMSHLLREGETSLLSELKDAGYYVWANARNDLVAGQVPGLVESHVSKMYYGGDCNPAPGTESPNPRGGLKCKEFYSFQFGKLKLDANGKNYNTDDEDIDAAIKVITKTVNDGPLCIFLGIHYPHPPYRVEDPYFSAIDRSKLPIRIKHNEVSGKPKIHSLIRKNQALSEYTEKDWNELRATYLGMCMKVDIQFKRVCDALKEAGEYDNTAIFFFSDHGDYTGDYGISEKVQNCFEDFLTNIPFLVKPPKSIEVVPGVSDSIVELVDFYATVMDFTETKSSHSYFGRSLRNVLLNKNEKHRDFACCEGGRLASERHCNEFNDSPDGISPFNIYWPRLAAQKDNEAHAKGTMIRTKEYKYIHRAVGKDEFYDLMVDPSEKINRIDSPEYTACIEELRIKLLDWYQNTCDIVPLDHDERFSPEMMWHKCKSLCSDKHEAEVKVKIADGANLYELINYCRSLSKNS